MNKARRARKKANSPGTHEHVPGQRCVRCRPYPAGSASVLPGQGPRDWSPRQPLARLQARKAGKNTAKLGPGPQQVIYDELEASRSRLPHRAHQVQFNRRPGGSS